MIAKLKAKELVEQYLLEVRWKLTQKDCLKRAKNCALTAVNEILSNDNLYTELFIYYSEVKREIEKL